VRKVIHTKTCAFAGPYGFVKHEYTTVDDQPAHSVSDIAPSEAEKIVETETSATTLDASNMTTPELKSPLSEESSENVEQNPMALRRGPYKEDSAQ
jgi:hypothetical protein